MGVLRQFLDRPEGRVSALRELLADQELTDTLLRLALRARGYDNFRNGEESGEHHFVRAVLGRLDIRLCLDAGAFRGGYSRLLLEQLEGCRVLAFEPLPANHAVLSDLKRVYPERLTVEPLGLGHCPGTLSLAYNPETPYLASFCEGLEEIEYLSFTHSISVGLTSIDTYVETHPQWSPLDFIKIDTEGYEAEVLQGACATLARFRPKAVQIEFNRHHMFRGHTLLSLARRLEGYIMFQLLPRQLVRRDPASPLANFFHFSNFAFLRSDLLELFRGSETVTGAGLSATR